jgi:hypothetical protein
VSHNRGSHGVAITRGEVWLAPLDPTIGSEIQKTRLCMIVSPAEMNDRLHHRRANDDRQPTRPFPRPRPVPRQIGSHPAGSGPRTGQAPAYPAARYHWSRYAEPHARNAPRDVRGIDAATVGSAPGLAANDRPVDLFHREAGSELDLSHHRAYRLGVDDVWGRIALRYRAGEPMTVQGD